MIGLELELTTTIIGLLLGEEAIILGSFEGVDIKLRRRIELVAYGEGLLLIDNSSPRKRTEEVATRSSSPTRLRATCWSILIGRKDAHRSTMDIDTLATDGSRSRWDRDAPRTLCHEGVGEAHRGGRAIASVDTLEATHLLASGAIEDLQACDLRLRDTLEVFTTRVSIAELERSSLDYSLRHLNTHHLSPKTKWQEEEAEG